MKNKVYLGIDPGKSGAAAIIHDEGQEVFDWPGDVSDAANKMRGWRLNYDIRAGALEAVHAMPKQGVSSTFSFGCNLGQWMGLLAALSIPYMMPRPQQWKKGLIKKADGKDPKTASLTVARRMFPDAELNLKKHHGRADALLLAWWAKHEWGR